MPLEKPAVVVALDEGPDRGSGLLEGFEVVQMDALLLERADGALRDAVALRLAYIGGRADAEPLDLGLELPSPVLRAPVVALTENPGDRRAEAAMWARTPRRTGVPRARSATRSEFGRLWVGSPRGWPRRTGHQQPAPPHQSQHALLANPDPPWPAARRRSNARPATSRTSSSAGRAGSSPDSTRPSASRASSARPRTPILRELRVQLDPHRHLSRLRPRPDQLASRPVLPLQALLQELPPPSLQLWGRYPESPGSPRRHPPPQPPQQHLTPSNAHLARPPLRGTASRRPATYTASPGRSDGSPDPWAGGARSPLPARPRPVRPAGAVPSPSPRCGGSRHPAPRRGRAIPPRWAHT